MTVDEQRLRFHGTTGALGYISEQGPTGANWHPDRCECQGNDPTPHKHYPEPPYRCARCMACEAYCPAVPSHTDRTGFRENSDWAEWFMHLQDPPFSPMLLSVQVEPTGLIVIYEGAATSHRDTARLLGHPKQIAMTSDMVEFLLDVLPKALAKKTAVRAADPEPSEDGIADVEVLMGTPEYSHERDSREETDR